MPQITVSDQDARILRELLNAKSWTCAGRPHTDSRKVQGTLYQVEDMLQRVLDQLPGTSRSACEPHVFGGLKASGYSFSGDLKVSGYLCFYSGYLCFYSFFVSSRTKGGPPFGGKVGRFLRRSQVLPEELNLCRSWSGSRQ